MTTPNNTPQPQEPAGTPTGSTPRTPQSETPGNPREERDGFDFSPTYADRSLDDYVGPTAADDDGDGRGATNRKVLIAVLAAFGVLALIAVIYTSRTAPDEEAGEALAVPSAATPAPGGDGQPGQDGQPGITDGGQADTPQGGQNGGGVAAAQAAQEDTWRGTVDGENPNAERIFFRDLEPSMQDAARVVYDRLLDTPRGGLGGYDELANALEPLGFVPDESVFKAYENLDYISRSPDLIMGAVAADDPRVTRNPDGSVEVMYPVATAVFTDKEVASMGWIRPQDEVESELRQRVSTGTDSRWAAVTFHPDGRVSTANPNWFMQG